MAGWRLRRAECRYPLMFPRRQQREGGRHGGAGGHTETRNERKYFTQAQCASRWAKVKFKAIKVDCI